MAVSYTPNQMMIKPYIKLAITCEFTKINTVSINSIDLNNDFSGNG
ncbi:autotransporter outer membrane beta-barrel domain-containing protein [Yersinia enterocolitica]|nr:autotransporter outer membrane beta-barrel domain-containing protein [Yersinia enterocolitica]EKN6097404.1 autotransporter outer membrane beta-barrel domain-containing protein [Yersinia enterocolitica]